MPPAPKAPAQPAQFTLVLCILGGAILTIPILGYGPLIAAMLGLAVGTVVMDRLANWAT